MSDDRLVNTSAAKSAWLLRGSACATRPRPTPKQLIVVGGECRDRSGRGRRVRGRQRFVNTAPTDRLTVRPAFSLRGVVVKHHLHMILGQAVKMIAGTLVLALEVVDVGVSASNRCCPSMARRMPSRSGTFSIPTRLSSADA